MERLTKRDEKGKATINFVALGKPYGNDTVYDVVDLYYIACDRLAAYEDTGLAPEQIQAQQQEIDQLKDENASIRNWNACEAEQYAQLLESDKRRIELEKQVQALGADKDEQAGTIMRLDNGLKKLRSSLQWLKETIRDLDYKAWSEDKIDIIDELLGGAKDGK